MKKMMQKMTAAMLTLACVPVTGLTAAAKLDDIGGIAAWDAFKDWEYMGQGSIRYESNLQLYMKKPDNPYRIKLALVGQNHNSMRLVLREDIDPNDAEKQIMEIVDSYIPGILEHYDATKHESVIPYPEGNTLPVNSDYQAKLSRDLLNSRYFGLGLAELPDNADELEANILLALARQHLISEYYGWGETAHYRIGTFLGLKSYNEQQQQVTDRPGQYTWKTPDWAGVRSYMETHHPGCSIEKNEEDLYCVTGIEEMTQQEQIGIACELWEQFDILPPILIAESGGEEAVGHNALENPGDTNLDCEVNILDVIAANKHFLGVGTLDKTGLKNADMDGNGTADSADTLAILKKVLE